MQTAASYRTPELHSVLLTEASKPKPVRHSISSDVFLIPLFGHTIGHCGVAIMQGDRWLFHIGDAYYLRAELTEDELAEMRADNDPWASS